MLVSEPDQPKQPERLTQTGDVNLLEMMRAIMEDSQKKMEETLNRNNEKINKKLDDNSKALKEDSQRNIESLNEKLNKNVESLKEDLNKKLYDNGQKMDGISKKMEENNEKIDREIAVVRGEITEVHERCEQYNQELQQTKEEVDGRINSLEEINEIRIESLKKMNQDEIKRVRTDIGERCEETDASVNNIRNLTVNNKEKIEELRQREILQIREELETIRNRPVQGQYLQTVDNRDNINFKNYKKTPIEFLERVEENLTRIQEDRWTVIRSLIDEYFKEIHDNWWTATRHEIQSYDEFTTLFRAKYWSESTQNIVRDDICHGKYDASRGTTPTSYFLGKVCLARNLEPRIPEECLVTKLAYHYEEGVARSRQWGQIKTIQALSLIHI